MKKILLTSLMLLCTLGALCACKDDKDSTGSKYAAKEFENVNLDTVYFGSDEISILVGETHQARLATTEAVVWSVDNQEIATVSVDGVISGLKEGRTEVHATVGENVYSCLVVVNTPQTYLSLMLDQTDIPALPVGSQVQINASMQVGGIDNATLTWVSSDNSIVGILSADNNGCLIEAKGIGEVTLTASCQEVKAVCSVNVVGLEETESGSLKISAINGLAGIKPSFDIKYSQRYSNNSNVLGNGHNSITSVCGDDLVYGKKASYQTQYTGLKAPYFLPGFGIELALTKQELQDYKKYAGLTTLSVDVLFTTQLYAEAGTEHTRYIDVLTGFEESVGQYTRCVINQNTWTTFTFDLQFIIDNYEAFTNITYDRFDTTEVEENSGWVMFAMTSDSALSSKPENVMPTEGCPSAVNGGNIGTEFSIYFGEIVLNKASVIYPEPYRPKGPEDYAGFDSVNAIADATAFKPSFSTDYTQNYENDSNYVTNGTIVASAVNSEKFGKTATYSIEYGASTAMSGAYYRGGCGFALPFTKEDLQNYKKYSGLTKLSVEICLDLTLYSGQTHVRYIDVLTGFDENGVGQYTRYAITNTEWRTFTFDIDELIENYDHFTNFTYDKNNTTGVDEGSGYVMFAMVVRNDADTLPENVTASGETAVNANSNIGAHYTIYFGEIKLTK